MPAGGWRRRAVVGAGEWASGESALMFAWVGGEWEREGGREKECYLTLSKQEFFARAEGLHLPL